MLCMYSLPGARCTLDSHPNNAGKAGDTSCQTTAKLQPHLRLRLKERVLGSGKLKRCAQIQGCKYILSSSVLCVCSRRLCCPPSSLVPYAAAQNYASPPPKPPPPSRSPISSLLTTILLQQQRQNACTYQRVASVSSRTNRARTLTTITRNTLSTRYVGHRTLSATPT